VNGISTEQQYKLLPTKPSESKFITNILFEEILQKFSKFFFVSFFFWFHTNATLINMKRHKKHESDGIGQ